MLIWVCALHCEAKPVIDFYRLKKSHADNAYDLYRNQDMVCIVSGPGKLASAAATAWIAAQQQAAGSLAWINLGIAGAAEYDIGSAFLLNQVIDADSAQRFYPVMPEKTILPGKTGLCLSQPSTEYHDDYLFDMESSGFMQSALRFSSAELIRCLKVVGDNRHEQTGRNRQRVSDLIQQHIEIIDAQARALDELNRQLLELEIAPDTWEQIMGLAHFSQTEQSRLRILLSYLLNRSIRGNELLAHLDDHSSAGAILQSLEALSRQDSERL